MGKGFVVVVLFVCPKTSDDMILSIYSCLNQIKNLNTSPDQFDDRLRDIAIIITCITNDNKFCGL